ncbi:MAG: hypothetical protein KDJ54_18075, partial [Candidatus Competibacteraceae bacterium]|nr:hypothetical protein [Candidatus Competibacteraceae bacterium]
MAPYSQMLEPPRKPGRFSPGPVEPALHRAQRRMGAVHEPSYPKRNGATLCQHPESTSIHPASSRRLNQGRARLVTPYKIDFIYYKRRDNPPKSFTIPSGEWVTNWDLEIAIEHENNVTVQSLI